MALFDAQQGDKILGKGFHYLRKQFMVSPLKYLSGFYEFFVTLNEFTFGFQSVSGLSVSRDVSVIPEGGVNDHGLLVEGPFVSNQTISFSRGLMIRFPSSFDKIGRAAAAAVPTNMGKKFALLTVASASPQETLEKGPALGFIYVYSREGRLRAKFSFLSLGMTDWSMSDLDAGNTGIAIESMTIAHTGLVREPVSMMPSIANISAISGSDSESYLRNYEEWKIKKAQNDAASKKLKKYVAKKESERKDLQEKLDKLKNSTEAFRKMCKEVQEGKKDLAAMSDEEFKAFLKSGGVELTEAQINALKNERAAALKHKEFADKVAKNKEEKSKIQNLLSKGTVTDEDLEGFTEEQKDQIKASIERRKYEQALSEAQKIKAENLNKKAKEHNDKISSQRAEIAENAVQNAKNEAKMEELLSKDSVTDEDLEGFTDEQKAQIKSRMKDKEVRAGLDQYSQMLENEKNRKAESANKKADEHNKKIEQERRNAVENADKNTEKQQKLQDLASKDSVTDADLKGLSKEEQEFVKSKMKDKEAMNAMKERMDANKKDQAKREEERKNVMEDYKNERDKIDKYTQHLEKTKQQKAASLEKKAKEQNDKVDQLRNNAMNDKK